jgi:steroid 5-alpha reductase family enzyme
MLLLHVKRTMKTQRTIRGILLYCLFGLIQSSAGFVAHYSATRQIHQHPRGGDVTPASTSTLLQNTMMPSIISSALQTGPWGVVALSGIASAVVLPLTMYRQGYSFSVGYGFSVAAMGLAIATSLNISMMSTSCISLLALGVVFYGVRLGSFLLLREWTVDSKRKQVKSFDKTPRLQRVPLAISVSIFYAFLTSPLLYAARATIVEDNMMLKVGVGVAWFGALMEAVTDGQKYWAKRSKDDGATFVGPTGGFYRISRHPNYLGEVLWWVGLALAGVPSFGKNPIPWVCSVLGLYGIYGIMSGATKRLDAKQLENYGGQEMYDTYRKEVPGSLWPWSRSDK